MTGCANGGRARRPGVGPATTAALLALMAACSDQTGPDERLGPPGLHVIAGADVTDTITAEPAQALVVQVRDGDGRPRRGVVIRFEAVKAADNAYPNMGVASLAARPGEFRFSADDTTDARGQAAVRIQLGDQLGAGVIQVTAPALGLGTAATFTVLPGAPASIALLPNDTAVYVGGSYPLRSIVRDRRGNPRAEPVTYDFAVGAPFVSGSGATVRGEQIGRARVVARLGALEATARASVVPRGVIAAYEPPIYYNSNGLDTRQPGRLVVLQLDGSEFRVLVQQSAQYIPADENWGMHPKWAPSGSEIAFLSADKLWAVDLQGAARQIPTGTLRPLTLYAPEYSADGQWLYFTQNTVGYALWRVRTDGSRADSLPADWPYPASPSPAPTGSLLVYHTENIDNSADPALHLVDLATGARTSLGVPGFSPRWSPTGEWIAYLDRGSRLRAVRPDGTGRRFIGTDVVAHVDYSWSPDAQWLVISQAQPTPTDQLRVGLALVNFATGQVLPLAFSHTLVHPSWRR